MPIRRHGDKFEVRVQHAGRRISRSFGNRRDAREFERRYTQQIEDHRVGRTPTYGLEEAIGRWLKGEAANLKSIRSIKDHIRPMYPQIQGRTLAEVVDVAQAVKDEFGRRGVAPATINRKLATLRRVANLAYKQWGWLDAPLGDRIRMVPGERQRHVYLTRQQVAAIAAKATGAVRDAILLAAMSGLRRGELLSLTPSHLKDGCLVLPDSKNGRPRVVPLPPEALKITLPIGTTQSELRHGFNDAKAAAGIDCRFHDLRHTYASWLVQSGQPLIAVRDLLGHASVTTTNRYAHMGVKHLRAAVKGAGIGRGLTKRKKKA